MVKVKPEVNTVSFRHEEPVRINDSKVNNLFRIRVKYMLF